MSNKLALIIAPTLNLAENWFQMSADAVSEKEAALAAAAMVGLVRTPNENNSAATALAALQTLSRSLEAQRKKITDPFLEAQRTAKRVVDEFKDEVDREAGRIENEMKSFAREEQRRIQEEQALQAKELQRIEDERQAELKRLQEEQEKKDREAREAQENAARLAAEATTKADREKAAAAARLAESKAAEAQTSATITEQRADLVNQRADLDSRIEAKPVTIARAFGQSNRPRWKIVQINDLQLMKARPDLVRKIEWDRVGITDALNAGLKLPGVTAEEDLNVTVRKRAGKLIDV